MTNDHLKKDLIWLNKVINSCKTTYQLDVAMVCVENFNKKWENSFLIDKYGLNLELNLTCERLKTTILTLKTNIYKKIVDICVEN